MLAKLLTKKQTTPPFLAWNGFPRPLLYNLRLGIFQLALLLLITGLLTGWFDVQSAQAHAATPPTPATLAAFDGLLTDKELCGDGYRLEGTDWCTPGPEEFPADLIESTPGYGLTEPKLVCEGDGVSGKRVQVLYVRPEDSPDRYADYLASFRTWVAEADQLFDLSAHQTGGHRHLRFVTDADCELSVISVTVPATATVSFRASIGAVIHQGYNEPDRKYLMFVDDAVYCGIATVLADSRPGADNRNNQEGGYARVDNGCWSTWVVTHELAHTLGGVQKNAPHSSGGWHCVDEWDIMCYSDTPHRPAMNVVCPLANKYLLDCNNDDYFHTNPPAGSYLATHWNLANSLYLISAAEHHNQPPIAELLTDDTEFFAPAVISLTVDALDPDGTVQRVELYNGTNLLATSHTVPFHFQWVDVKPGTYTLSVKVFDDQAASTTSTPLTLVVNDSPVLAQRRLLLPFVVVD
jgi:hypothetical protein